MSLGEKIKTVRTDNGLTQKDFANLFGLSHSHISNLENNREKPSDALLFMCSKFGINYEWLKFGKADDTSKDENTRTFLHNYGKQILIQVNLIKKKFQMMK